MKDNQNFFTFIMEYCGGTYISQIEADDVKSACKVWAQNLEIGEIVNLGWKGKENLIKQVVECEPTVLRDVVNVWFEHFLIYGKSAYVNIIRTVK